MGAFKANVTDCLVGTFACCPKVFAHSHDADHPSPGGKQVVSVPGCGCVGNVDALASRRLFHTFEGSSGVGIFWITLARKDHGDGDIGGKTGPSTRASISVAAP